MHFRKAKFGYLVFFFLGAACSNMELKFERRSTQKDFLLYMREHSSDIFTSDMTDKIKACLNAYLKRKTVGNGLRYGDSVRNYSLVGKTAVSIRKDMSQMGCKLKEDVLRNPKDNAPVLFDSRTIPMQSYLCPDGGVVRVKPVGNPLNKFRSEPQATKGLRYPHYSSFEGFSDEIVKVDNYGHAIPKSRLDLKPKWLVDGWSDDAHTSLLKSQY